VATIDPPIARNGNNRSNHVGKMTQAEAILGQIRLKSCAMTFSGTEFVCRKTCVKNWWGLLKNTSFRQPLAS
jgi:hypothetical protein